MRLKCSGLCWLWRWGNLDLNQRPTGYESAALTAELLPLKSFEDTTLSCGKELFKLFGYLKNA